jgi:RNA polymerase sigma factor (TIGR02999 family)
MEKRDLTTLLNLAANGDKDAASAVWAMVYREVRAMALRASRDTSRRDGEGRFEASAIVSEVYLRLESGKPAERWDSRAHYFGAVARAMHRFLIDTVRSMETARRGGGVEAFDLGQIGAIIEDESGVGPAGAAQSNERAFELLLALEALEAVDSRTATILRMRYVFELSSAEIATALDIDPDDVQNHARFGRAWIRRRLDAARNGSGGNSSDGRPGDGEA